MNYKRTTKYEECYEYLINSIQHFDDVTDIDKRIYFITIHTKNDHNRDQIRKLIYGFINRTMTGSMYNISSDRPGLIISDDVESTRVKHAIEGKPLLPHFHGTLVLSKNSVEKFADNSDLFQQLKMAIYFIREVVKFDIRPYEDETSLLNTIDYALKVRNKYTNSASDIYDFRVYPYESDIHSKNTKLIFSAPKESAQRLSDEVLSNPSKIFSKNYLAKFGYDLFADQKFGLTELVTQNISSSSAAIAHHFS